MCMLPYVCEHTSDSEMRALCIHVYAFLCPSSHVAIFFFLSLWEPTALSSCVETKSEEPCSFWGHNCGYQLPENEENRQKTRGQVDTCHASCHGFWSVFYLVKPENRLISFGASTGTEDVRMWEGWEFGSWQEMMRRRRRRWTEGRRMSPTATSGCKV